VTTGLRQVNECRGSVHRVPAMDWIHVAELLAIAAGAVTALAVLIIGTLAWFLNHPRD